MQIRLINVDKMIRNKRLLEVTNFNLDGPGSLFDPNIFGHGDEKIKRFGYIKLNGHFVHPVLYNGAKRLWRELPSIIDGRKRFIIDKSGNLVQDPLGETGLEWLYNNFDRINLKKLKDLDGNKLTTKRMKKSYDKLTRDEFFIDKILVKPLHFRDLDTDKASIKIDELNQYYIDILKAAKFKERTMGMSYTFFNDAKIQGLLASIYDYLSTTFDKDGIQKGAVMSRSIDNAVRLIAVIPEIRNKDVLGKGRYTLNTTTLPLHHFLNGCPIQAITASKRILQSLFDRGKFPSMSQDDFDNHFTDESLKEALVNYDHSHLERLQPVKDSYGNTCKLFFKFRDEESKQVTEEERDLTWVDLFYLAADMFREKTRAMITRYPITGKDSNIFVKINLTVFTVDEGDVEIYLNEGDPDPIYEFKDNYPNVGKYVVNPQMLDRLFDETVRISNLHASGLGLDYDGDKMSIKILYSKESVQAVDNINNKAISYLNIDGSSAKSIAKEAIQSIYNLTLIRDDYIDASKRNIKVEEDLKSFFSREDHTLEEVLLIIDRNEIEDVVQWKGKFTTFGRVLFNELIFGHIKSHEFINKTVNKSGIGKIVNKYAASLIDKKISINDFVLILDKAHDLGFGICEIVTPTIDYDMLIKDDPKWNKKKEETYLKYKEGIDNNDASAMKSFEDEMLKFSKEYYKDNPMIDLYNSGASPKWGVDWKTLKISLGAIPDPGTGKINVVKSNLKDGMTNDDINSAANLQIYGAFSRAQDTALGGYMVKRLIAAFQSIVGYKGDCKTKEYLSVVDTDPQDLLYRYIKNPDGGEDIYINTENINDYLNKPIEKRSPIFCKGIKGGLCSHCLGEMAFLLSGDEKVNIGLSVPNIGSVMLNAYMKATHDMGAKLFKLDDLDNYIE